MQISTKMSNTYSSSSMIRHPRETPADRPRFPDYGIERTTETAGDFSTLGSFQQQQQHQSLQQSQERSTVGAKTLDSSVNVAPSQPPYAPTTTNNGGGSVPAAGGSGGGQVQHWRLLIEHWHATIAYCAVFWSFGMCVAFLGPTLLDLGCQVSADMRAVSWVFVAQLFCSLAGATVAGYLVRR
jgi:hypothetical protein